MVFLSSSLLMIYYLHWKYCSFSFCYWPYAFYLYLHDSIPLTLLVFLSRFLIFYFFYFFFTNSTPWKPKKITSIFQLLRLIEVLKKIVFNCNKIQYLYNKISSHLISIDIANWEWIIWEFNKVGVEGFRKWKRWLTNNVNIAMIAIY